MKITDYRRSTIGTILGTAGNASALDGVSVTGAAASNYHLVALTSNSAQWLPNSAAVADGTYLTATLGTKATISAHGSAGATETVDLSAGNYHTITLNADCTVSFSNWTNGVFCEIGVRTTEDGTGGWTPTFSGVTWPNGTAPTHTTTAATVTEYVFWSSDGGSTIYGGQVGAGGSFVLSHPSTSSNSFTSNAVFTNDASVAVTMPEFGTLHFSAPFVSEVVTDGGEIVWDGDDVVHDLVRLY